jgi:hypothetical protein
LMDQIFKFIIGDVMTEDLNGISRSVYCHHVDEYLVSFLVDTQPDRKPLNSNCFHVCQFVV